MSNENKFGPWHVAHAYSDGSIVVDSEGFEVVDIPNCAILHDYAGKLGIDHWADDTRASKEISTDEQIKLCHLVAAAPEMLEALKEAVSDLEAYVDAAYPEGIALPRRRKLELDCIQKYKAIIAKAEGDV